MEQLRLVCSVLALLFASFALHYSMRSHRLLVRWLEQQRRERVSVQLPRGTFVGVAKGGVQAGEPVFVDMGGGHFSPVCGAPPPDGRGGEGCNRPTGHDGPCRASSWGTSTVGVSTAPGERR